MGQRQSSQSSDPSDNNNNDITMNESSDNTTNNDTSENTTRRGRIFRPSARLNVERNNPISRASNDSQRRSERRTRRARIREEQLNATTQQQQQQQQGESENEEAGLATLMSSVIEALDAVAALARNRPTTAAPTNISNIATTTTTSTSEESGESVNSPFARMIAQVMSEAVLASFRSGQISTPVPNDAQARQQLTMHLPADLFRQMEPGRSEDVFLRPFRLPILITPISASTDEEIAGTDSTSRNSSGANSNSNRSSGSSTRNTRSTTSTAVNADGEAPTLNDGNSQVSQLMFLPVLICGRRSASPSTASNAENSSTTMSLSDFLDTNQSTTENTQRSGTRSSTRIRERQQRQQESAQQQERSRTTSADTSAGSGQWTVWILSGPRVESFMSDNPTYEDLIQLADLLGPARLPTVTQETIDNHIPIVKYTQQVKQNLDDEDDQPQPQLSPYPVQLQPFSQIQPQHPSSLSPIDVIDDDELLAILGLPASASTSATSTTVNSPVNELSLLDWNDMPELSESEEEYLVEHYSNTNKRKFEDDIFAQYDFEDATPFTKKLCQQQQQQQQLQIHPF
ncbi:hypothetical protein MBANPS3_005677 [Mucor bainieri]